MTFDQFKATGRDSANLGVDISDDCLDGAVGRVYLDCLYITHWLDDRFGIAPPNGPTWTLPIFGDEHVGELADLEKILFDWAASSGYFDEAVS